MCVNKTAQSGKYTHSNIIRNCCMSCKYLERLSLAWYVGGSSTMLTVLPGLGGIADPPTDGIGEKNSVILQKQMCAIWVWFLPICGVLCSKSYLVCDFCHFYASNFGDEKAWRFCCWLDNPAEQRRDKIAWSLSLCHGPLFPTRPQPETYSLHCPLQRCSMPLFGKSSILGCTAIYHSSDTRSQKLTKSKNSWFTATEFWMCFRCVTHSFYVRWMHL